MVNSYKRQERIRKFYYNSLKKLYAGMIKGVSGTEHPLIMIKMVNDLSNTLQYQQYVDYLAKQVFNQITIENAKDWREAVFKSYKPNKFYKNLMENTEGPIQLVLNEKVSENARLIKTLPSLWAEKASEIALEKTLKGYRADDVKNEILSLYGDLSETQAFRIARTEISKANAALTQARSQINGINWYTWRTSNDARVRESHDHMEGVLVNFNDPPSPEKLIGEKSYGNYHAGEAPYDRCYMEPVIDVSDIKFPAKVYYGGRISRMKKSEFLNIA